MLKESDNNLYKLLYKINSEGDASNATHGVDKGFKIKRNVPKEYTLTENFNRDKVDKKITKLVSLNSLSPAADWEKVLPHTMFNLTYKSLKWFLTVAPPIICTITLRN